MDSNTVQVRNVKDMTTDEQQTAKLESLAFLTNALEAGDHYVIAVFHGDTDTGSIELDGNASGLQLATASKVIGFQAILGQADDPQAILDRFLAEPEDEEEAA